MHLPKLLLCAALALLPVPSAQAAFVVVPGLYSAETVLEARDDEARAEGLRNTLAQVLVRVSGQTMAPDEPAGRAVIEQAEALVSQFRFELVEPEPDPDAEIIEDDDEPGDEPPPQYRLIASFVPGAVDNAMRRAGLQVWPPRRPRTLVWLVTSSGRGIIDESASQRRAGALVEAAQARGLPLLFPVMDIEDRRAIEAADIRGGFFDRVRAASRRYDVAEILVGHIARSGSLRTARWALLDPDVGAQRWSASTRSSDEALSDGMAGLAQRLVSRYAGGTTGPSAAIDVAVHGIAGLPDYARTLNMFGRLNVVEDTTVLEAQRDTVVFRLMSGATVADLARAIDVERVLVRDDSFGGGVLGAPNTSPGYTFPDSSQVLDDPGSAEPDLSNGNQNNNGQNNDIGPQALLPVGETAQLHYRMR